MVSGELIKGFTSNLRCRALNVELVMFLLFGTNRKITGIFCLPAMALFCHSGTAGSG
jgi:hypothetical protein